MKVFLVVWFVLVLELMAYDVVPHDQAYYTKDVRNTQLIYTKNNLPFAQHAAEVELQLQPLYEDAFGYQMDETLYVGLVSDYNQIANGFSTQYPNNRQINYVGGALQPDYFCATSWLDTLLYHETTHNYQGNAKDNLISSSLHSVIGNGAFFIPWFSVPNIVESSFLLEGNAVLNESWHGNGGRLYSGRFKIATLMQAKAGRLTPEQVYNDNFDFLYGSHFYTLGGFYNAYLGETYGLKALNSYWKAHSQDWFWPFFTNNAMEHAIGVDFEDSFEAWSTTMQKEAQEVVQTEGEVLARSQFFYPLNGDASELYFIINESGRETPNLVVFDKSSQTLHKEKASYLGGRVLRTSEDHYVTQGSNYTSPWRIYIGLFDEDAFIIDGTESKAIQGYLSDGRAVYFDVPSSYDQPKLYVGSEFYNRVNSSVVIDNDDNLYYFRQEGKTRTLFKNKTPLYSFQGYYGIVSDVDSKGNILFIANTEHGSGLYRFNGVRTEQMSPADTIIDARLIRDDEALVAVMGSDAFSYEKVTLSAQDAAPFEVKVFVEDEPYYKAILSDDIKRKSPQLDLNDSYYALLDMHYSGANVAMGSDKDAGFLYNVALNFGDPLRQNAFSVFVTRNLDELTLAGASYTNNQYFLQYSIAAYGVVANDTNMATRDYGVSAQGIVPLLKTGYYGSNLTLGYYQDYDVVSREPYSLSLDLYRSERFGVSVKTNYLAYGSLYATSEREDKTFGGSLAFEHELPFESYIAFNGQYSKSDASSTPNAEARGVKLTSFAASLDNDPSTVVMPSLRDKIYLESVGKVGGEFSVVSNLSYYFFTFPISLRREVLSLGYTYYDLTQGRANADINEAKAAVTFDTFWMNKLPIPITLNYFYNDNQVVAEEHTVRVNLGFAF